MRQGQWCTGGGGGPGGGSARASGEVTPMPSRLAVPAHCRAARCTRARLSAAPGAGPMPHVVHVKVGVAAEGTTVLADVAPYPHNCERVLYVESPRHGGRRIGRRCPGAVEQCRALHPAPSACLWLCVGVLLGNRDWNAGENMKCLFLSWLNGAGRPDYLRRPGAGGGGGGGARGGHTPAGPGRNSKRARE